MLFSLLDSTKKKKEIEIRKGKIKMKAFLAFTRDIWNAGKLV